MRSVSESPIPEAWTGLTATELAPLLLGKSLCRRLPDGTVLRWPITETEAYDGFEDKASHAHRGPTPRNQIMFERGGRWYVYLCYGVHWLLNLTAGPAEYPAAVLIRGAGRVSGPGRLTKALHVDKSLDGQECESGSGLWIESSSRRKLIKPHLTTPRIGIGYAGGIWVNKPWRFVLSDAVK